MANLTLVNILTKNLENLNFYTFNQHLIKLGFNRQYLDDYLDEYILKTTTTRIRVVVYCEGYFIREITILYAPRLGCMEKKIFEKTFQKSF